MNNFNIATIYLDYILYTVFLCIKCVINNNWIPLQFDCDVLICFKDEGKYN